ncbi:MAG: hypothetical protein KatS3mg077_0279 [Candidatus Binatia bacterium]|nr:MAG: hypothetical protein KatS3mg077_0279 [Candidatus Binatia bacterium]
MQRLLLTEPAITVGEVLFVAAALLLLFFIPAAAAFANRRQYRSRMEPVPLSASPSAELPQESLRSETSESDVAWLTWPVNGPPPSFDPWHPEEESIGSTPKRLQTQEDAGQVVKASSFGESSDLALPPALGAIREWPSACGRYRLLPPLPLSPEGGQGSLEALRQISLPTWPVGMEEWPAENREIWGRGLALYRQWQANFVTLALPLPAHSRSYAIGRVETDGQVYRVHVLLFDELWPLEPDEALAVCVFDLDPERGLLAYAVLPAITAV